MATRAKIHGINYDSERREFWASVTVYQDSDGTPVAMQDFTEVRVPIVGGLSLANVREQVSTFAGRAADARDSTLTETFGELFP